MSIPIVILYGWGSSSQSFQLIKEILARKGFLVYVPDLPGFGKAQPPPQAWTVDDYTDFVWQFIQSQKIDRFYLFGHSFGGRVGIKFAIKYPEKLAGLILCDAAGVTPRPKIKTLMFRFLSEIGNRIFSISFLKIFRPLARKFVYFLARERDYYFLKNKTMKETFRKIIEEDLTPFLSQIQVRSLIIWGEKDKMTPINDAYKINRGIPNSQLKILENIGHSPYLEAPEILAEIIEKFIK